MFTIAKPTRNRGSSQQAWTLIELLLVIFTFGVTELMGQFVAKRFGFWAGIGAGALSLVACTIAVILFYRWAWRRDKRRLQELREKYRTIYRVAALPTDKKSAIMPEGAEIRVGDYGWEAGPILRDGLIYLQGLTVNWSVVWHAGFRPDQIEKVATKPSSQYDHWVPYWATVPPPPPCPYPVLERKTPTMGLPHHSHKYFVKVSAP